MLNSWLMANRSIDSLMKANSLFSSSGQWDKQKKLE